MKKATILVASATLFLSTSCATIVSGSKQKVNFTSTPENASVIVDDQLIGTTPIETKLERKKEHKVVIKLDGYKPYETTLTKKFNGWYIGNILFGGIIGLIVDPITGAIYNLTPKEVNASLQQGVAFKKSNSNVYIAVSLQVDKNWKKVGQLEKL